MRQNAAKKHLRKRAEKVVKKELKIVPLGLTFGLHFGLKKRALAPWGLQGPPGRAKGWPGEPPGSQKAVFCVFVPFVGCFLCFLVYPAHYFGFVFILFGLIMFWFDYVLD